MMVSAIMDIIVRSDDDAVERAVGKGESGGGRKCSPEDLDHLLEMFPAGDHCDHSQREPQKHWNSAPGSIS